MTNKILATDTLVVGAGQAGVAMSEHLSTLEIPHLVLERSRIAERWRTGRWDSLVANGPAWHDRFPNLEFEGMGADQFAPKERIADYFETYARQFNAPIHTGVDVTRVARNEGKPGFRAETTMGTIQAHRIVAATGPFQRPVIPPIAPATRPGLVQLHSADYFNPDQLPVGAVLVVGAGSSGVQIADELNRAGKRVFLSVGPHERPPRAYRSRDFCWWLGVLGEWDAPAARPGAEHVTIAVSGARGGRTVDFRELAHQGIVLTGLTSEFAGGIASFQTDLRTNIARGDESYFSLLRAADAYAARNGMDLPADPDAWEVPADPPCIQDPILQIDLGKENVTAIIWATGYAVDYSWLSVDAFDEKGRPRHQRGISAEPGVYFLGLPWLSRRGSAFIWGVWHDAMFIADHISTQRKYASYRNAEQRQGCI